jgi:predicted component of type VI protein secretion system
MPVKIRIYEYNDQKKGEKAAYDTGERNEGERATFGQL